MISPATPDAPVLTAVNATAVTVAWDPPDLRFGFEALGYEVEMSLGPLNDSFARVDFVRTPAATVGGLGPLVRAPPHTPSPLR